MISELCPETAGRKRPGDIRTFTRGGDNQKRASLPRNVPHLLRADEYLPRIERAENQIAC